MSWKDTLRKLEEQKEWDAAIEFMLPVIQDHSEDKDAWIFMNYVLMSALYQENHKRPEKHEYYLQRALWYFYKSYQKFSDDPEYLYLTGRTAVINPGYFRINQKDQEAMLDKARRLDPENLNYQESYYWELSHTNCKNPELIAYARTVLAENSAVQKQLGDKGALGEYLLKVKRSWCERILSNSERSDLNAPWKEILQKLEHEKRWDEAIQFMQYILLHNQDDKDAHIFMNYLLMNLLGEEDYDSGQFDYYAKLAKWYFDDSFAKYADDAEFLYIIGKTAVMGPWHFGIDQKDYEAMIDKARRLDPDNLVYKEPYYWDLSRSNPKSPELIAYAHLVLSENSPIEQQLKSKGAVGAYLLEIKRGWCESALHNAAK